MIEYATGDIFKGNAEALVNPVNCVGTMGKGLALGFKKRWPRMFTDYQEACRRGRVMCGRMYPWPSPNKPSWIICFPTKVHWRDPSMYAYIEAGLKDLAHQVTIHQIPSIAIPALGCGYGGLDPIQVIPMIAATMVSLPRVRTVIYKSYEPGATSLV